MRWPLTVSVQVKGGGLRPVTRHVSGLRFGTVAPGGSASCSFHLAVRPDSLPGFGPASRVAISDARTGRIVWDGYAEYPDPTHGDGVDGFDVSAVGAMVVLTDESKPHIFIDGPSIGEDDGRWRRTKLSAPGASVDYSTRPGTDDESTPAAVVLQFPSGQKVDNSSRSGTEYDLPTAAGVGLMYLLVVMDPGVASGDYGWKVTGRMLSVSGRHVLAEADFGTTVTIFGGWMVYAADGTGLYPFVKDLRLQIHRLSGGVTTVDTDTVWVAFSKIGAVTRLKRLDGTYRDGNEYDTYLVNIGSRGPDHYPVIPPHWAVEDMIARLPDAIIDKAASSVEATSAETIDQLAYPDGATVAAVLDDLALLDPDYTWEVAPNTGQGHPFHYRKWAGRYEIPRAAGVWDAEGADVDLCNRVQVSWETKSGRSRSTTVTASVPALGARTRDADPVELPAGVGSTANAEKIGAQILATLSTPTTAGTFTASGRIYDRTWGRWVEPWEVQAGWTATLQETGQTLRVTEVAADDNAGTATLSLGERSLTLEQRIARLDTTRRGSRGRRRKGNRR